MMSSTRLVDLVAFASASSSIITNTTMGHDAPPPPPPPPPYHAPTAAEMDAVFQFCRRSQWTSVLNCIKSNVEIAVTKITMDNNIETTTIHQAITSKGDTKDRTLVIEYILEHAPDAAKMENGYGSLPLHVIAQRNTKMDSKTKERIIRKLIEVFPDALLIAGGVGQRTPLHIIFTDYVSPDLTALMIETAPRACSMKDRKGYLPAHVACSRHCSPEKLQMLLEVHPQALDAKTNDDKSLLGLATGTATKSHPNYALIGDLRRRLSRARIEQGRRGGPQRVGSNDSQDEAMSMSTAGGDGSPASVGRATGFATLTAAAAAAATPIRTPRSRKRKVTAEDDVHLRRNLKQEPLEEQQYQQQQQLFYPQHQPSHALAGHDPRHQQADLLLNFASYGQAPDQDQIEQVEV